MASLSVTSLPGSGSLIGSSNRRDQGTIDIPLRRNRLPVLIGLFTNDLAFDRLMRTLRSAHHFSKNFYLWEIIHDASIVTCVHVRGARLRAIDFLRAATRTGRQL